MKSLILASAVAIVLLHPLHANAESPPTHQACERYIERGTWVYRYSEWTLELAPTECGRQVSADNTAHMFYEMSKKFGGSPYWVNTRGIINQLTCHLVIARDKPTWNLDPWRPYVGHSTTVANACNPEKPAPDQDFQ